MQPTFPKRAVVTAGMPYANKGLHFGHIGGVFIPADCYARFLRDRIGPENVLFVCGSDCYGSTIDEGYRKLREDDAFDGTVLDYVEMNHRTQTEALKAYDISLDIYEGSALGASKTMHEQVTTEIIEKLYHNGWLTLDSTAQFYDEEADTLLNGRQVIGHCPVQGCKSQKAYADECDLGHQYRPEDLLDPKSTITGKTPVLKEAKNWYVDVSKMSDLLKEYVAWLREDDITRAVVTDTMEEFLAAPIIYIKEDYTELYENVKSELPPHAYRSPEKGKVSFELEFASLDERDIARDILSAEGIRLRTGKTLVPFRITANIAWGVPAPVIDGVTDLTVWCWPESLWAPISFSRALLETPDEVTTSLNSSGYTAKQGVWTDYWCSKEARVYQFIGQDNIYFYGIAQPSIWSALNVTEGSTPFALSEEGQLQQTQLIANFHLLFLDKKASSSADVKPPMATELLTYYTAEQLRAHFVALGINKKAVSFKPKVLNPDADEKAPDPTLRESALLTNIFNRLARSCFYEAQKSFEGYLPSAEIPEALQKMAHKAIADLECAMYNTELHTAFEIASEFIRQANKYWSDAISQAGDDVEARKSALVASFYLLRVATVLMHPFVPKGCELIFKQMDFTQSAEEYFSWEHIHEGNEFFFTADEMTQGSHRLAELPPRFDFFEKHPSQVRS